MKRKVSYGNRLKVLREQAGYTQADLAEKVGVTRQTIISIERGKYSPSLDTAFVIADAFDLEIGEVFFKRTEDDPS